MVRVSLATGALIALGACVATPDPRSPGLEDLVSCRLNTPAANDVFSTYASQARSGALVNVGPDTVAAYAAFGSITDFHRPNRRYTLFGAQVEGLLFDSIHGSAVLLVLARGDPADVRRRIEAHGGWVFQAGEGLGGHWSISGPRRFGAGVSLGRYSFPQEIQAGAMFQMAPETPGRFMAGCVFAYG